MCFVYFMLYGMMDVAVTPNCHICHIVPVSWTLLVINEDPVDLYYKLMITYHDKATQTETEEEDTIEKILKAITTLCTKMDSMDNEIQKLKTNEDNLKSKASQQHDYKNAELRRSEDGKNPELNGDDGKLLKTHNICLNIAADISDSMAKQEAKHTENREKASILCHPNVETGRRGKPFRGVNKVEALIRRKYPLKYDTSSDRKT
ncbi:hypothetical protein MTR67_030698 [Solanum verrucosum]|uniref:Uncharacterized protein n=1 Tax=Solanum verrucosum TaxID=315347 RepID=A0AAF0U140_SOLVR|nr:hypothetical protein MTR67_030698 [Solanum verrucosum]